MVVTDCATISVIMSSFTVFFDGACPLCIREIALLRRMDRSGRIRFQDISPPDASAFCPIPQEVMLARFHAQRADGQMLDGAEAFTEAYGQIPYLIWLKPIGRFAPTRWVLNQLYGAFLKIRPHIQKFFVQKAAS